jgi:uncharacterized protein YaiL (DUF2058 family)
MSSMSLREQLLAAGFVSKKQVEKVNREQYRQAPKQKSKQPPAPTPEQQRLEQARIAKAARDQELNRQRQENAEMKARWAQIKQLIEQHKLPKIEGEDYLTFNFIDRGKVRRIAVDAQRREKITGGELTIARCEGRYEVVPAEIGQRIRERHEKAVVVLGATEPANPDENDPYKDFVVPDDLTW